MRSRHQLSIVRSALVAILLTFTLSLAQEGPWSKRPSGYETIELKYSEIAEIECDCTYGTLRIKANGKEFVYTPETPVTVRSSLGYSARHNRVVECLSILKAFREDHRLRLRLLAARTREGTEVVTVKKVSIAMRLGKTPRRLPDSGEDPDQQ